MEEEGPVAHHSYTTIMEEEGPVAHHSYTTSIMEEEGPAVNHSYTTIMCGCKNVIWNGIVCVITKNNFV